MILLTERLDRKYILELIIEILCYICSDFIPLVYIEYNLKFNHIWADSAFLVHRKVLSTSVTKHVCR